MRLNVSSADISGKLINNLWTRSFSRGTTSAMLLSAGRDASSSHLRSATKSLPISAQKPASGNACLISIRRSRALSKSSVASWLIVPLVGSYSTAPLAHSKVVGIPVCSAIESQYRGGRPVATTNSIPSSCSCRRTSRVLLDISRLDPSKVPSKSDTTRCTSLISGPIITSCNEKVRCATIRRLSLRP